MTSFKEYIILERQIFHEPPKEIAIHFKEKYGPEAIAKMKHWVDKYKHKLELLGGQDGGYAKELRALIANIAHAITIANVIVKESKDKR